MTETAMGEAERSSAGEEAAQRAPLILDATMTCEAAFRAIMRDCSDEIDRHLAVFLNTEDLAGPHKARVALRRLTTALDAFAPILRRDPAAQIRREAKRIFRTLGEVRDADVYLEAQAGNPEAVALARDVVKLRNRSRRLLRKEKAVAFAPSLLRQLGESGLLRQKPRGLAARAAPLTELAGDSLDRAWRRALRHGEDPAVLDEEARHDFRKDMKTLRYLAEYFAPIWHEDAVARAWPDFRESLQALQDELGELNDLANARSRGKAVAGAKEEAALRRASRAMQGILDAGPFWRAV